MRGVSLKGTVVVGALIGAVIGSVVLARVAAQAGNSTPNSVSPLTLPASTEGDKPPDAARMPRSRMAADTPSGFISFCLRFPEQCEHQSHEAIRISMTAAIWTMLRDVNRSVNSAIWPEDDLKHYGRHEYWTVPTDGYGDCEDYALSKKKNLMAAGLPASALRLAIVYTQSNVRHMVLTVAANNGDYVLDSVRNDIVTWNKTGYFWLQRQNPWLPSGWLSINPLPMGHAENEPTSKKKLSVYGAEPIKSVP